MRNGIELATCYYACFAAGFVAVPVNTRLTPEEIAYVLEHSGAKAYLAQADLRIPTSVPSWEFDMDVPSGRRGAPPARPASRRSRPAALHQRHHGAPQGRQPFAAHHRRQRVLHGRLGLEAGRSHFALHGHGARLRLHHAADVVTVDGSDGDHCPGIRRGGRARHLGAQRRDIPS